MWAYKLGFTVLKINYYNFYEYLYTFGEINTTCDAYTPWEIDFTKIYSLEDLAYWSTIFPLLIYIENIPVVAPGDFGLLFCVIIKIKCKINNQTIGDFLGKIVSSTPTGRLIESGCCRFDHRPYWNVTLFLVSSDAE